MAADTWTFPAPHGLRSFDVSDSGYRLEWVPVTGPAGQHPESYTVATFDQAGHKVDQFTVHGTNTAEYARGGHGLKAGTTYHTHVWANGAPKAPPHTTITVTTLHESVVAMRKPSPLQPTPRPPFVSVPSQGVKRAAVAASRAAPPSVAGHPMMWAPWDQVVSDAEARMRTEITEALHEIDRAMKAAGKILDVAYAQAAEVSGQLESAAWAAWRKYMDSAGRATDVILNPAVKAYEDAIARAHADFDRTMAAAETAYKSELADASRAQSAAPPAAKTA